LRAASLASADSARAQFDELNGRRVDPLGLAFKPDSDDMKDATCLKLITELISRGAEVVAYDPSRHGESKADFGRQDTACETC
jgi:UDP-glucose 6-dehydrogenase